MTTDIQVSTALPELAANINREHGAAVAAAGKSMEHALRCGELLKQAKSQLEHGQWGNWLSTNCAFSDRTARAYMQIADRVPALDEGKRQRVAEMPLRLALSEIAEVAEPPNPEGCPTSEDLRLAEIEWKRVRREILGLRAELEAMCEPNSKATMRDFAEVANEAHELSLRAEEHRIRAERALGQCLNFVLPYFDRNGHLRATEDLKKEAPDLIREVEALWGPLRPRGPKPKSMTGAGRGDE